MAVERINYTGTDADNKYLDLSISEIATLYKKIRIAYETKLRRYGVKPPWNENRNSIDSVDLDYLSDKQIVKSLNARELQLVFLLKYRRKLVHKDLISKFVRKYIPNAALDQQVRHLGTQYHWNILNKNASIPDEDEKVPSAFHYLVSIETPNPSLLFDELKRKGRLAAKDFSELKIVYDNRCATCGRKEGTVDLRQGDAEIRLQKGHMDPSKALDISNTIPQCQYCNRSYGDDFCFDENGRVISVYNPQVVLRSPKHIQDEMITLLLNERRKKTI
jgi:hypothetical protein